MCMAFLFNSNRFILIVKSKKVSFSACTCSYQIHDPTGHRLIVVNICIIQCSYSDLKYYISVVPAVREMS